MTKSPVDQRNVPLCSNIPLQDSD